MTWRANRFVPVKDKGALISHDADRQRASTFDLSDDRAAYEPPSLRMYAQLLPGPDHVVAPAGEVHRVPSVELLERRPTATRA
jgi:hypothetical protein